MKAASHILKFLLFLLIIWIIFLGIDDSDFPLSASHIFPLSLAIFIWVLGYLHTGKYIKPKWKIFGKLVFYLALSNLLIAWFGYYSLIFIIGHQLIGFIFHLKICKKYRIDWISCEPREKYLTLQEKWAKGEFKE